MEIPLKLCLPCSWRDALFCQEVHAVDQGGSVLLKGIFDFGKDDFFDRLIKNIN